MIKEATLYVDIGSHIHLQQALCIEKGESANVGI
jgi:hypothetical protein